MDTGLLEWKYMDAEHLPEVRRPISESGMGDYPGLRLAAKVVGGDVFVTAKVKELLDERDRTELDGLLSEISHGTLLIGQCKLAWIDYILKGAVGGRKRTAPLGALDRAATSRRWGRPLAVAVTLLGLVASFVPAMSLMVGGSLLSSILTPVLTHVLEAVGAPRVLIRLVCDVRVNALYFAISMIGFVFGITLMFGFTEETSYVTRISYVFDQTVAKLGLQGKATMPSLVSLGCTIGGVAGTRMIDNWGRGIPTVALTWVAPYAAARTIVPVISSVFFGSWAPLIIVAVSIVALAHMWVTSKVLGRYLVRGERTGPIMEPSPCHRPKWDSLFRYVLGRTEDVLVRALKAILMIPLISWLLSCTSDGNAECSVIYRVGTFIEPATRIFGLSWQTSLVPVSSAVSKEAALGVPSSPYTEASMIFTSTVGGTERAANLREILAASIGCAEALVFIFVVTFNTPCIMAVTSIYQETHSAEWTGKIALYYVGMALLISFPVYHVSVILF